jgi:hypothetical protein
VPDKKHSAKLLALGKGLDSGSDNNITKTVCKSRRVRYITHLDMHTRICFILCKISNNYKYSFGFTQVKTQSYLQRLSGSVLQARERESYAWYCSSIYSHEVQLLMKLQTCPQNLYMVTTNIMRAILYFSIYTSCSSSIL